MSCNETRERSGEVFITIALSGEKEQRDEFSTRQHSAVTPCFTIIIIVINSEC